MASIILLFWVYIANLDIHMLVVFLKLIVGLLNNLGQFGIVGWDALWKFFNKFSNIIT